MSTLLIVYETKYGQTQKIAERIAELTRQRGHDARVVAVADIEPRQLSRADAYAVLAPIFVGKHPSATKAFLAQHGEALNARPSAFLSVSGAAASPNPARRDEAHAIAVEFIATTRWRPNLIRTAGGAIAFPLYGFFTRFVMKMIARREGGSTDTSRTHELTDWKAIERLTRDLLSFVEPSSRRRAAEAAAAAPVR